MKNIFLVFILVIFFKSNAQIGDSSSPKHFAAGVAIGAVGGYTANKIFKGDRRWTWAGAIGSALAAGIVKETIDKTEYGLWDNSDIVYTTLGGAVSGLALEFLLDSNSRRRGRGKPCSCYALNFNKRSNFSNLEISYYNNGSGSLSSSIQAHYLMSK